jgi:hypothetical protein
MNDVPKVELQHWIESLLGADADRVAAGLTLQRIAGLSPIHFLLLIECLEDSVSRFDDSDPAILAGLLLAIQRLAIAGMANEKLTRLPELDADAVDRILDALPVKIPNRSLMLYLLSANRSDDSLRVLATQLSTSPPENWTEVGQALSPLMQHSDWDPADFYPAVLDSLVHPSVAATILDLANHLTRTGCVSKHPATDRSESLIILLGGVTGRLGLFETSPMSLGVSVEQVQQVLAGAVALATSLCDALGLIGCEGATGKLYQAMELRHRRVQCEAAGALARLGVEAGRTRVIELAAEPSARLRVIAYAEELDFGDQIEDRYKTNEAIAEAELSLWLSQPANMGVPPTDVEVIDQRTQFWPGFENPIDCFLVRFEYRFAERTFSNVGITGPTTYAMSADLADLPTDDIYAVYAGWQVEHDDIFTVSAEQFNSAQRRIVVPLEQSLDRLGFEAIRPILLGFVLDEQAMVASAYRDGTECLVITDGLETVDFSTQGRLRPMTPPDLWYLYLGRKLLRTFN